jgi:4-hydroxybenzoate polyprenyltransferase
MAGYSVSTPVRDLLVQLLAFGVGSTLLHSAACVLNDICDIDFDKQVGKCRILTSMQYLTAHAIDQSAQEADRFPLAL